MSESNEFWDLYWEMRLQELQNLGKREAILAASRWMRRLADQSFPSIRLLELGCGEGQVIGALAEGHARLPGIQHSLGIDYLPAVIETCRRRYPHLRFALGDFTDTDWLAGFGQFEVVLLVNALHEVFTSGFSAALGEIDVIQAKRKAKAALAGAVRSLAPGGILVLFDGLEMDSDIQKRLRIRFLSREARQDFETFAREYHPFHIGYREVGGPLRVELNRRDFTRYITKSIFLGKPLWQSERLESYQYFNQAEFRQAVAEAELEIRELRTLTVDEEKWNNLVEIETPGEGFPEEHILIVAQKNPKA